MQRPIHRWLFFALLLGLGSFQAWDSGVARTTPPAVLLAAAGIAALAVTPLVGRRLLRLVPLALGVAALLAARAVSPVPLPDLGLIAPVAFIAVLPSERRQRRAAGGAVEC